MSILWLTENLINSATPLYASTEDTIYTLDNLYIRRPSFPFRWLGDRATPRIDPEWICVDLGQQRIVTFVGVFNHNLGGNYSAAEFVLKGCDSPCPGLSGACDWNTLPSGSCNEDLLNRIVANHRNSYKLINCYNRYFYLGVSELQNPIPQIGEWVLGEYSRFSKYVHLQPGAGDSQRFFIGESETHYGQDWRNYYSELHEFDLVFQNIGTKYVFDEFALFLRTVQQAGGKFILVLDDDTKFCYYCVIKNLDRYSSRLVYGRHGTLKEFRLELKTLAEGIVVL